MTAPRKRAHSSTLHRAGFDPGKIQLRTLLLVWPGVVTTVVALAGGISAQEPRGEQDERTGPNETILEIVGARALRLPEINGLKAAGVIGENNRGLVEIVDIEPVEDPVARIEVNGLVVAENADREKLYRVLVSNGKSDESALETIRQNYAELLRGDARPGDWIQLPDGTWKQKKAPGES